MSRVLLIHKHGSYGCRGVAPGSASGTRVAGIAETVVDLLDESQRVGRRRGTVVNFMRSTADWGTASSPRAALMWSIRASSSTGATNGRTSRSGLDFANGTERHD